MHVELAVVLVLPRALARQADVLPNRVQEHDLEEKTRLGRLHLRDEDARRGMACLRRPVFRMCEGEYAGPLWERRDDFEWLRQGPGFIPGQHLADSGGL